MTSYKLDTEDDSNPHRERNRETPRGLVFMIFSVYLPLILLAILVRKIMLSTGTPILSLGVVDGYVNLVVGWVMDIANLP